MKEIASALVKAQAHLHNLGKDAHGYGYKYLTLDKLIEETRTALADCGLVIVQTMGVLECGQPTLITRLIHESGELIEGEYPITFVHVVGKDGKNKTNDAQAMGSAITYARRYCLAAMLNIAQADDDGQAAGEPPKQQQQPASKPRQQATKETPASDASDAVDMYEKAEGLIKAARIQLGDNWTDAIDTWCADCMDAKAYKEIIQYFERQG